MLPAYSAQQPTSPCAQGSFGDENAAARVRLARRGVEVGFVPTMGYLHEDTSAW
jgi:hypothetical protein